MKCIHCSKEIPNDSNFCEYCGFSLHKPNGTNPFWNIMILVLFLCAIALGGLFCYEYVQYKSAEERIDVVEGASNQVPEPVATVDGNGTSCGNDINRTVVRRDSLLLEMDKLQKENKNLQRRIDELEEENGYLSTDVRLAREALEDCMRR